MDEEHTLTFNFMHTTRSSEDVTCLQGTFTKSSSPLGSFIRLVPFLWNRLHFIKHCWEIKTLIKWSKCFVIYLSKWISYINIGHERWTLLLCLSKLNLTHCISLWNIQRAVYVFLLCNILQNYPYWFLRPYYNTANPLAQHLTKLYEGPP